MLSLYWISSVPTSELDPRPVCQVKLRLLYFSCLVKPSLNRVIEWTVPSRTVGCCSVSHKKWQPNFPIRIGGVYVLCYRVVENSMKSFHQTVTHRVVSRFPDFPTPKILHVSWKNHEVDDLPWSVIRLDPLPYLAFIFVA